MKEDFYRNLPRLVTNRLILRKYALNDVDAYFAFASDPALTEFLRWGPHPNREFTFDYMRGVLDAYASGADSPWGIELKAAMKLIGTVHLMGLDRYHQKAQIGCVLAKEYWHSGYAAEAMQAVIQYCFTELGLNRVEAYCTAENQPAARLMERVGMQPEGLLRQYLLQKGRFWDFQLFAILKEDYVRLTMQSSNKEN